MGPYIGSSQRKRWSQKAYCSVTWPKGLDAGARMLLPPHNNLPMSIMLFVCAQWLSHVQVFATPWTVAHQVLLSMGFPRQEYWSGLPFPPPEDLPKPGIKPMSPAAPALGRRILYHWATWEAHSVISIYFCLSFWHHLRSIFFFFFGNERCCKFLLGK